MAASQLDEFLTRIRDPATWDDDFINRLRLEYARAIGSDKANSIFRKEVDTAAKAAGTEKQLVKAIAEAELRESDLQLPPVLASIQKKTAEWLVEPYIPLRGITMLAADGGTGKSTVEAAIAAAVSSGSRPFMLGDPPKEWDRDFTPKQDVLFFSGEDFAEYTLKQHLEENGADQERIIVFDQGMASFSKCRIGDPYMEEVVRARRPQLLIIDPVQSFLDSSVNMISRNQIRQALVPLSRIAKEYGLACLIACHTNKRDSAFGRNRMADSSDLWDLSRSVLMMGRADSGMLYLSHEKSNWSMPGRTVLFRFSKNGPVEFVGYSDKRDEDFQREKNFLKAETRAAPIRDEAEELILEALATNGKMSATDLKALIQAEGIKERTYRDARESLQNNGRIRKYYETEGKGNGPVVYYEAAE